MYCLHVELLHSILAKNSSMLSWKHRAYYSIPTQKLLQLSVDNICMVQLEDIHRSSKLFTWTVLNSSCIFSLRVNTYCCQTHPPPPPVPSPQEWQAYCLLPGHFLSRWQSGRTEFCFFRFSCLSGRIPSARGERVLNRSIYYCFLSPSFRDDHLFR